MKIERTPEKNSGTPLRQKPSRVKHAQQAAEQTAQAPTPAGLRRSLKASEETSANEVLHLQRVAGNRAVQRLLAKKTIQAKLIVGPANDKYELEAEQVAQSVTGGPERASSGELNQSPQSAEKLAQRQPLVSTVACLPQRSPTSPKDDPRQEADARQAGVGGSFDADRGVEAQLEANRGRGTPLPDRTRTYMESRIGSDFSKVRVHTGGQATQVSRRLGAQAFTHGSDIYFSEGKYNPNSAGGKELLAHELTHVVQQTDSSAPGQVRRAIGSVIQRIEFERSTSGAVGALFGRADTDADKWVKQFGDLKAIVREIEGLAQATKLAGEVNELKDFVQKYDTSKVPSGERDEVGKQIGEKLVVAERLKANLPKVLDDRHFDKLKNLVREIEPQALTLSKTSKLRKDFNALNAFVADFGKEPAEVGVDLSQQITDRLAEANELKPKVSQAVAEKATQAKAESEKPKPEPAKEPEPVATPIDTGPKKAETPAPEPEAIPAKTKRNKLYKPDKWWANFTDAPGDVVRRIAEARGNEIGQHTSDHRSDIAEEFEIALEGKHYQRVDDEVEMLNGSGNLYDESKLNNLTLPWNDPDALAAVYEYTRKNGKSLPSKYPSSTKRQLDTFPLFDAMGKMRGTFKLAHALIVITNTLSNNLRKDPGTAFIDGV